MSSITTTRPRIVGAREDAIFDATLTLLSEVGYDRLTMDAVATAARAGKASLYRRWRSKGELVVDALGRCKPLTSADTGSLRGDLLATTCPPDGEVDEATIELMASLLTAMHHDADLRGAFERFLEPRLAVTRTIFARAKSRGEIDERVDIEMLVDIVPSTIMHRLLVRGENPTPALITRVIDEVLLPAAHRLSVPPA